MAHLVLDAQISSPEAVMDFTRDMGAYVAGYTIVRDMVDACVEARAHAGQDRWKVLRAMMAGQDAAVLDTSARPSR